MSGQFGFGDLSPLRYFSCTALVLGVILAFVSPDDNLPYGWLIHLLQWLLQTCVPMVIAVGVHSILQKQAFFAQKAAWLKLTISGAIAGMIFSPLALASDVFLAGEIQHKPFLVELVNEFTEIVPPIVLFWVVINLPFQLGWALLNISSSRNNAAMEPIETGESEQDEDAIAQPAFTQLLPQADHYEVIYLKSELHYLKVVTTTGSHLILYSISKADSELSPELGIQPHRSFWVNLRHITDIKKKGREAVITVSDGSKIPVSRSRLKTLHERWSRVRDKI